MEEVLVDNMVSGEQASLNCLKIESFKSIFSVATTKSTPTTPSLMSV
jgi:hypothetical protein